MTPTHFSTQTPTHYAHSTARTAVQGRSPTTNQLAVTNLDGRPSPIVSWTKSTWTILTKIELNTNALSAQTALIAHRKETSKYNRPWTPCNPCHKIIGMCRGRKQMTHNSFVARIAIVARSLAVRTARWVHSALSARQIIIVQQQQNVWNAQKIQCV